jgi:hypothetical protein
MPSNMYMKFPSIWDRDNIYRENSYLFMLLKERSMYGKPGIVSASYHFISNNTVNDWYRWQVGIIE